jgi:hypothetical protein
MALRIYLELEEHPRNDLFLNLHKKGDPMKKMLTAAGLAVLLAFSASLLKAADKAPETKPSAAGALDGKSFSGEIGEKGKKADPDTFLFKNGRFTSTACEKFGFKDAAYTTSGEGKNMRFRATTTNPSGAKIDWDGMVNGGKLEGKAVLNQPGKPAEEKLFKAKVTK